MVYHGMQWQATAPSPEPEMVVTMLYQGVIGAIEVVGSIDTDRKD